MDGDCKLYWSDAYAMNLVDHKDSLKLFQLPQSFLCRRKGWQICEEACIDINGDNMGKNSKLFVRFFHQ